MVFVDDLTQVPEGANLLFSAHGVAPEIRRIARLRRLTAIDATCPLVTKVHLEAMRFAREGYKILLIGHAGHDEVIGTIGEAPGRHDPGPDRRRGGSSGIAPGRESGLPDANHALGRRREPDHPPPASPISATGGPGQGRHLLRHAKPPRGRAPLCAGADLVLVVGSQNSSNSQRLRELAAECGVPAHLIDGVDDLDSSWFTGVQTVVVTAGASAPESIVEECLDYLREHHRAEIEICTVREEAVYFPLPRELRS